MTLQYPELKRRKHAHDFLSDAELDKIAAIEAISGYVVELLLPKGSKMILGTDDAEQIYERLMAADLTIKRWGTR